MQENKAWLPDGAAKCSGYVWYSKATFEGLLQHSHAGPTCKSFQPGCKVDCPSMGSLAQSSWSWLYSCSTHPTIYYCCYGPRTREFLSPICPYPSQAYAGTNGQPKPGVNLSNYEPQTEFKQLFLSHKVNEDIFFFNQGKQFKQQLTFFLIQTTELGETTYIEIVPESRV